MIKQAKFLDIGDICRLCNQDGLSGSNETTSQYDNGFEYYEWFKELFDLNHDLFFVYKIDNKVVGFILGERLLCNGSMLWMLGVKPELQNGIIGIRLLQHYEKSCKENGITWIVTDGYEGTIKPEKAIRLGYKTNNVKYRGYYKEL